MTLRRLQQNAWWDARSRSSFRRWRESEPCGHACALAGVAITALACGDGSTPPAPAWAGTYSLRTVQAKPLPVTINATGIQVHAGAITLRPDGSYARTWETRQTYDPGTPPTALPTLRCSGRYVVREEMAEMTETSGTSGCESYDAGLRGDTIFFASDTLFGVYVR